MLYAIRIGSLYTNNTTGRKYRVHGLPVDLTAGREGRRMVTYRLDESHTAIEYAREEEDFRNEFTPAYPAFHGEQVVRRGEKG